MSPPRALVVCEAGADFVTATEIADRQTVASCDGIEPKMLEHLRCWSGMKDGTSFLRWIDLKELRQHHRIRPRSRFAREKGAADAMAADIALQLALREGRFDAVFLLRDSDNDDERRKGLNQARERDSLHSWPFQVIIGLAHPKREAWVLAGFQPKSAEETERIVSVRKKLGFDPCTSSHELTASKHRAKRDIKRVLHELTGSDPDREASCWQETDLAVLAERGQRTGLADYLDEVRDRWVPVVTKQRQPSP